MHVLVTGGNGRIGPRIVKALHDEGYGIRTLSLDPPAPGLFPENVEVRVGDITDWDQM